MEVRNQAAGALAPNLQYPIDNILRPSPVAQSIRLLGSESPSSSLFHEFLSSRFNIFSVLPQEQGLCGFTSENPLQTARGRILLSYKYGDLYDIAGIFG